VAKIRLIRVLSAGELEDPSRDDASQVWLAKTQLARVALETIFEAD
jgi:hypothetical protein